MLKKYNLLQSVSYFDFDKKTANTFSNIPSLRLKISEYLLFSN